MVGLDLVAGEGNPGAILLRHQAAEGSAIEDCTIDATGAHTGIQGGIGSGGSSANVTVIGGRIGLDFTGYLSGTQPTPVITGFTLIGQTEAAIRSTSRQTLVVVGLKIVAVRCRGPLIQVPAGLGANLGALTLVDSAIEFGGEALRRPERVVVSSGRSTYLQNVYVRGATCIVDDAERKTSLAGDAAGWLHVRQFAARSTPRATQGGELGYPVYVDGSAVERVEQLVSGQTPPADLQSRHLWPADFPHFEGREVSNVRAAPFGAKGDGRTDDAAALQRAIDAHDVVFLPKGCYLVSRTIELRPRTKLIGVGQAFSLIVPAKGGAFDDAAAPAPVIRTADTAAAETVLAFIGLDNPTGAPGVQFLAWRSGGRSIFRGVEIKGATRAVGFPVVITGHGGGAFYNFRDRRVRLLIDRAPGPLRFCQFSVQQVTSEMRGARRVDVFGTKHEGNNPMFVVSDSDRVRFFGHGGNAKGRTGASLFVFERTTNFLFANGVDGPTRIGTVGLSHPEGSTDPKLWHMLIERRADGSEFKLPPLERPVLFQIGAVLDDASADLP